MVGRVITITSGKGGVGKTTTTANLGMALARLNNKVTLIDADIGLRNLDLVMGLEKRVVHDLVDVVEGRCTLRQAMVKHKQFPDLYLIPASQSRDKNAVSPSDMVQIGDELRPAMDYVLIDCPAGIERGFRNAIAPADEVIVVTNPEVSAVRDADRVIGLLEQEGKTSVRLIINRIKAGMVKRGEMLSPEQITDLLNVGIVGLVPEDEHVVPASNAGVPVTLNESSRAGVAFRNIARRLTGEEVPFMQLEEKPPTFFQRLGRLFANSGS